MNKQEFKQVVQDQFDRILSLTNTKGEEYSQSTDQLANFKRQAEQLGIPPQVILMVYLNKHLDAIRGFIRTGTTMSEPISGRIDDAILYLILLQGMVTEATGGTPERVEEPMGALAPSEDFPIHGWAVREDDEHVTLMAANRHFKLIEMSGTEAGKWVAQQLRGAMERLTGQVETPS